MEGTVMEKGSSFISDKISSKSTQKGKKVVRVDAEKVEIGKVQAPEVSSTSLYIRRNSSLNQLLTKTPLEPLTLPTSPLEKMNLQGRWTEFPSPLPMPPVGSMDENGQSHHKDMPIRMKSLPSFGFKIGKLAETSLSCRKKRPMSRGSSSGSPARRKTGGRGPPAVVPIKNRQRRRRTALTAIPKMAQSSLSNWVTHTDAGANSVMGGKCKSIQEQQRAILSTAYSVMQEASLTFCSLRISCGILVIIYDASIMTLINVSQENDRNRKALHEILNIVNRELIQKNECYRMLMRLRRESPNSENAADIVQLLTEVVVHGGDRPEEKQSGTLVECGEE